MANSKASPVSDEGALDTSNVPELLAQAWRDQRTGCLQLSHGRMERRIDVRDGAPVGIEASRSEDTFARFLEDHRKISPKDREAVEKMAADRTCPQASAVLALKLIDSKTLYQALRSETRNRIAETFDWNSGMFRWMPEGFTDKATSKPYDLLALFQEQLPRRWGTERLFQSLMEVEGVYGDISPRLRRVANKLARAGDHAERAIARLDGSVPLGRILGESAGDPLAAATLWIVLKTGILRLTDQRPQIGEPASLEFELHVETAGGSPTAGGSQAGIGSDSAQQDRIDSKGDSLRHEIETLIEQLDSLDHYSALGLATESNTTEAKKAYFKAAKKYHPDALARLGLNDLKDEAARVFARIAEAFDTLSDPQKKAAYDSSGNEEPEFDTATLAQAETAFRKGEILTKMGNFDGALEYLQSSVDLWPDEPAYQGGLGWALYKQSQPDLAGAVAHLEIALSQAPEDASIHFRLGLVIRASGETNRANELISKARAIDPDVSE